MKIDTVKGFRDFVGNNAELREEVRKVLVDTFERYGFLPAETPIVEYEEFVKGENSRDEAISDIFKLRDKGKRKLALRYEFTFQLKRIAKNKKLPFKRYQIGPVFRDEPVSTNRFRQFTQCDGDCIGSTIKDEAEILKLTSDALITLGISPIVLVNNRKLLNEILEDNKVSVENKAQVLREIDKYDKLPENQVRELLRKLNAEKVLDSLKKGEKYFKKFESYKEIISLIEYCKAYGIKINFSPSIVRGLSYYNGSVFEIKAKGVKETIVAGGSYECCGIQATGLSFGLERICNIAKILKTKEKLLVVSLDQDRAAINLAKKLRAQNKYVSLYFGKPTKALDYANSYNIKNVIFVGLKEVKKKKFLIKDMKTGKQKTLVLSKTTKKNVVLKKK